MDINFLDHRQELQRIAIQKIIVKAIAIIFGTSFVILSYWGYQQIKIDFSRIELEKLETKVKSLSAATAEVQAMKLKTRHAAESIKEIRGFRNNQLQVLQVLEGITLSVPNGVWLTKIEQLSFKEISSVKGVSTFFGKSDNVKNGEEQFLKIQGNLLLSTTGNPLTTYVENLRKVNHFKKVYLQKINTRSNKNAVALNFALLIQLK
jgi:Tfp pilus assembly protein PilN